MVDSPCAYASCVRRSPSTGAHEVYGIIRDAWADNGWEAGPLGYPTSGEYDVERPPTTT